MMVSSESGTSCGGFGLRRTRNGDAVLAFGFVGRAVGEDIDLAVGGEVGIERDGVDDAGRGLRNGFEVATSGLFSKRTIRAGLSPAALQ